MLHTCTRVRSEPFQILLTLSDEQGHEAFYYIGHITFQTKQNSHDPGPADTSWKDRCLFICSEPIGAVTPPRPQPRNRARGRSDAQVAAALLTASKLFLLEGF